MDARRSTRGRGTAVLILPLPTTTASGTRLQLGCLPNSGNGVSKSCAPNPKTSIFALLFSVSGSSTQPRYDVRSRHQDPAEGAFSQRFPRLWSAYWPEFRGSGEFLCTTINRPLNEPIEEDDAGDILSLTGSSVVQEFRHRKKLGALRIPS
jgi:hypothetical protein